MPNGLKETWHNVAPDAKEITVVLPPEPPELNPKAAYALLKILLKAHDKQFGTNYWASTMEP